MKRSLLFLFVWMVKISAAQYCGTSGPDICTTGGLSAPGITDYTTFPCVHNNVPYTGTIQIYFPTNYVYASYNIIADSITLDSITNLPCGLCWQCNSPTFTYAGGGQACIQISGTANEKPGAYQLSMYGRVFTPFGVFPGTLDNIGFQFFLNVVGQNDTCAPINIQSLHTACATPSTDTACHFAILVNSDLTNPACQFDSATLMITQPTGSGYQYEFAILSVLSDSLFPFSYRVDSGTTSALIYNTDITAFVSATDSSGCTSGAIIDISPLAGPVHAPTICYATADSSATNSNSITVVFERDDWFNNITNYTVHRQDDSYGDMTLIGSIPANDPGYIIDTMPLSLSHIDSIGGTGTGTNTYSLTCQTACGDTLTGGTYVPFILGVDTNPGGYPSVYWINSTPINYDEITIFSRYPGGNWRLRFATGNLVGDNIWLDFEPDSTQMQYMAGLSLTVDCDPNRAASHTAFSNFGSINVNPAIVTNSSPSSLPVITGTGDVNAVLYPNPTGDKLNLQITNAPKNADWSLRIFDMLGQPVLSQTTGVSTTQQIDVSLLPPGVYTLNLYNVIQPVAVRKFLKN